MSALAYIIDPEPRAATRSASMIWLLVSHKFCAQRLRETRAEGDLSRHEAERQRGRQAGWQAGWQAGRLTYRYLRPGRRNEARGSSTGT